MWKRLRFHYFFVVKERWRVYCIASKYGCQNFTVNCKRLFCCLAVRYSAPVECFVIPGLTVARRIFRALLRVTRPSVSFSCSYAVNPHPQIARNRRWKGSPARVVRHERMNTNMFSAFNRLLGRRNHKGRKHHSSSSESSSTSTGSTEESVSASPVLQTTRKRCRDENSIEGNTTSPSSQRRDHDSFRTQEGSPPSRTDRSSRRKQEACTSPSRQHSPRHTSPAKTSAKSKSPARQAAKATMSAIRERPKMKTSPPKESSLDMPNSKHSRRSTPTRQRRTKNSPLRAETAAAKHPLRTSISTSSFDEPLATTPTSVEKRSTTRPAEAEATSAKSPNRISSSVGHHNRPSQHPPSQEATSQQSTLPVVSISKKKLSSPARRASPSRSSSHTELRLWDVIKHGTNPLPEKRKTKQVIEICDSSTDDDDDKKLPGKPSLAETPSSVDALPACLPPATDSLKRVCWSCHVPLQLSGALCCYTMHSHLLLQTPTCSVCQDKVEAVEEDRLQNPNHAEHVCAACGAREDEVDTFFLCDNDDTSCNRAFCWKCVVQAHGGGAAGWQHARSLQEDDSPWYCPVCEPTPVLKQLHVPNIGTEQQRLLPDVMHELAVAEAKKKECLGLLDHEDSKIVEIRNELKVTCSSNDLEEEVESELALWKQLQLDHCARLDDFISLLQDELEVNYGVHMAACYGELRKNGLASNERLPGENEQPDWVREADAQIAERDARKTPVTSVLAPAAYKEENYGDVDEIDSQVESEAEETQVRSTWRNASVRATKDEILCAKLSEDRLMAEQHLDFTARCDDEDVRLTQEECKASYSDGRNGISRIRRDAAERLQSRVRSVTVVAQRGKGISSRGTKRLGETLSAPPKKPRPMVYSAPTDSAQKNSEFANFGNAFQGSTLVLCSEGGGSEPQGQVRTVSIARELDKKLKSHQRAGVHFIWKNAFCDFAKSPRGDPTDPAVGGCILAHNMVSSLHSTAFVLFRSSK